MGVDWRWCCCCVDCDWGGVLRNPTYLTFPDPDQEFIMESAKALRENVPYTKEDEAREKLKEMWKHWPWTVPHAVAGEVTFADIARAEREQEPRPVTITIRDNGARALKWSDILE